MVLPKVTETWAWNSSSRNFLKKFFEIKSLTQFSSHNLTSTLQLKTRTSLAAGQSEWEKQPATRSFSHKYCCGNWQILWPKKNSLKEGRSLTFQWICQIQFPACLRGKSFQWALFHSRQSHWSAKRKTSVYCPRQTFCNDQNVVHLCLFVQEPPGTLSYRALEM